jgi:hypothetical protein
VALFALHGSLMCRTASLETIGGMASPGRIGSRR